MRINQFVAAASGLSRRGADAAVAAGRVTIENQPAQTGQLVTDAQQVQLDGQPLALPTAHTYLVLNKPTGYVTSRVQQGTHPTIYELLPPEYRSLRPVGRLDQESCGLLLLTDDGAFIHRHTHPSFDKAKTYQLTLDQPLTLGHQRQLESGVRLKDGLSRLTAIKVNGRDVVVGLSEGRNRQIRRTFGALGYRVDRLERTQMGSYTLGNLAEGAWRLADLTPEDV